MSRTGRGLEFLFSRTLSVRFHVKTAPRGRLIEDRLEKPLPCAIQYPWEPVFQRYIRWLVDADALVLPKSTVPTTPLGPEATMVLRSLSRIVSCILAKTWDWTVIGRTVIARRHRTVSVNWKKHLGVMALIYAAAGERL